MKKIITQILLVFCISLCFQQSYAQSLLQLSDGQKTYPSKSFIAILEDSTGGLSFEDVSSYDYNSKFVPSGKDVLHFGINEKVYWLRLRARDLNKQKSRTEWVLWIDFPILDEVSVYQIQSDGKVSEPIETGFCRPFERRPIAHSSFAFPLELKDTHPSDFYIRIVSKKTKILPISVVTKTEFYKLKSENDLYYGIFFGIMLVMILYNLFIYFSLKDISYLYYVLTILSTGLFFAGTSGYGFQYLWPSHPEWNVSILVILSACICISASLFAQSFLYTKKNIKFAHYFYFGIIGISVLGILLALFHSNILLPALGMYLVIVVVIISLLITGGILWRRGNKSAFFFSIAWFGYLLGGMAHTFVNWKLLKYSFFTAHGSEIGAGAMVVILGLALSEKYKSIKKEKEQSAEHIIEMQQVAQETLEKKVSERTAELSETNEELNQVVEELNITNERLLSSNDELSSKNKNITASINYAKRIQTAILPFPDRISRYVKESFILYKPRDIVSGDFYWFEEVKDKIFIICADCTGHGVPGAFMSLLGSDALTNTILNQNITDASKILTYIDLDIQTILQQEKTAIKDGIDMSVCVIDKSTHTLEFSGAKSQIIYFQNGELNLLKGDKFPIGGTSAKHIKRFSSVKIDISSPTWLYLYTDGYPDQFGGPDDRKFMIRRFKALLTENHQEPMVIQKTILENRLEKWMNGDRQIDDITVMGFRLGGK